MTLVRFSEIVDLDWHWLADDATPPAGASIIVSLGRLETEADTLLKGLEAVGVVLRPDEAVERLIPFIDKLSLVAVDFPVFGDGRGYSSARVLREQMGFLGEIRGVGDVLADQLRFMKRCGFDSAKLADRVSPQVAERALDAYHQAYQAASDDEAPVHRLRRLGRGSAKGVA